MRTTKLCDAVPSFTHAITSTATIPTTSCSTANATRSQWTKTFANGDSYNGEALHVNDATHKPIKDGRGRYTWAVSGAVYDGEWKDGRPHGSGVMTVPGADGYEYTGDFVDGQRSGRGRCHFANGRIYDGEWKADEMNGSGTAHGAPGADDYEVYTGPFEMGKRSGSEGHCVYLNGDVYDGSWLAGRRQGMGEWRLHRSTSSLAVAPVVYKGPFDKGVPHTTGSAEATVEYSDGSSYTGAVDAQLRRHGRGVHRLANGDVFEGVFAQDQREGRGTLQGADGAVCDGTWRRGQLDGEVRVSFASASPGAETALTTQDLTFDVRNLQQLRRSPYPVKSYEGPCSAGVLTGGNATLLFCDGSTYNGAVRHGLPHGTGILRDRPLLPPTQNVDCVGEDSSSTGSSGLRGRIAAACIPASATMTLVSYDGTFSAGEPDGTGTAEWHVSAPNTTASRPASPSAVVRATPYNFSDLLAEGLRWWPTSSYAAVDGTYTGQWLRGLPHGRGAWQWADGASYKGEVASYLPSGQGVYTSSAVQYTGDFKAGVPDGKGVLEDYAQYISYDGEWSAGRPHGEGVCTVLAESRSSAGARAPSSPPASFPNTSVTSPCTTVYEGSWESGKPSGQGRTYASPDRQRVVYDGHHADGRRDGEGTLYFGSVRRGSINSEALTAAVHAYAQYRGAFNGGYPGGGRGRLTLKSNTTIEGEFDAELQPRPGTTIEVRPQNGAWTFTGTFDAATRVGHGTMTFPNGDIYTGEVEDATADAASDQQQPMLYNLQRHGQGLYSFVEGNQLQCTWRHNVLHGAGVYTTADGTKTERAYVDGVLANDTTTPSVGASGGLSSVGIGGSIGNVFTPENEFPNTLSEEALRSRLPEVQQPQQQRKRAPFSFVRRGEARQASAVGAAHPPSSSSSSLFPRHATGTNAKGGGGNSNTNGKRSPSTSSLLPASAAVAAKRGGTSPRHGSSPQASSGAGGGAAGGANGNKYSLRHHTASGSPTPAHVPASTATTAAAAAAASGDGGKRRSTTTTTRGTLPAQNSVYISRFQAGIRQLDNDPPRSPSPSADKSAGSSSTAEKTPAKHGALPATTPAWEHGSLRRHLTSALAAGREQQQQQQQQQPPRWQSPVSLDGSLKEMMKAACAIRNSREDEIHLLTEEMRQLNERIWQLRYVIAQDSHTTDIEGGVAEIGDTTATTTTPTRGPASPARRLSRKAANAKGAEAYSPASRTQRLAGLVQERRIIMEKLQYVVNAPE